MIGVWERRRPRRDRSVSRRNTPQRPAAMPVIVNCPSCKGPLRVTDELLGRKVRCPTCQTIFEATEPPPEPRTEPRHEESERIDSWKQLDLELNRDPAPPPPRPAPPPLPPRQEVPPTRPDVPVPRMPGLVGAVEV